MKKFICGLMSLLILFSLASCSVRTTIENSITNESKVAEETTRSDLTYDDDNDEKQPNENNDSDGNENTNKPDNNKATLGNVNNGVLKQAALETMDVPQNMTFIETSTAKEENNSAKIKATVVLYTLDGDVVNWATENDLVYVITAGNNRLVVIDSNNMVPVYNTPLAGVPAEMNILGDKIYISFPDLYRIDVFSKSDCKKESSLYFDHEVSSFCIDGNYIYYSEHDQHCRVFKKNLTTNEITMVQNPSSYFYYPKLYLNKENNILYIGECNSNGSAIYYLDASTLALKSMFKKDNYGITNHTREIFHIGNDIFWGNYRLSDTNARELVGRYGTADYGSVTFASEEAISTYEGLFITETYECVIDYFDAGFNFEYILVSQSYNFFFRQRSFEKNIIFGVNFDLQETTQPFPNDQKGTF